MSESVPLQRRFHDWLNGKPLHHPLHTMLVHLPIGLFTFSFVLDLASWLAGPANWMVRGAFYTLGFGILMTLVAAVPGLADWADIRSDRPAKRVATLHMVLNLMMTGLYVVNFLARLTQLDATRTPLLLIGLSLVSLALLYLSGYLGGMLIYDQGVSVGRHRRPGYTPGTTVQVPEPRQRDEFVPVAYANQLNPGQTLRAQVNGYVMVIANLNGEYFAFQEFCTHRFGPLSEGSFHDGQVQCPWHRSCFDVRTGKVTQGPAKVDLKTFDVQVVDGVIQVRVPPEPASHEQAEAEAERQLLAGRQP